jgi:hypothetical protein
MEVLKGEKDFTSVKLGLSERELLLLNVQHEIPSADVLHDKVNSGLGLEARVQVEQERVAFLGCSHEDPLLGLRAER